ncbi:MAG: DNA polymerase III subunit gamma/tau [Solirubrobacterales bacterium]|nr:DNA polymerase III subunit gamma/tau [Solirubrobacterales bacterium]
MSQEASLYRRHRPRSFDQVVGQQHVVRTLSNAISQDKVHHAYLFVGSRGTGKTSMAKILAASLNCVDGPTLTPCGRCESCRSIAAGTSVDVIEMDAASNRSVDDIRALRDRVAFAPAAGHWKVYILDEAHMLTKEAWNAFLKTLEEPPPNTVFILATTEAHKVMPTIADRCQRFDFQRPSVEQLAEVIDRVAGAEQIRIEPPAVSMVARAASGSFRDALGTLDQLVAFTGPEVNLDSVLDLLGAADAEVLFGVIDAVAAEDPAAVLETVERVARSGQDPVRFARDLLGHLRVLLVTQVTGEIPEAFAVTAADAVRLRGQATALGPANLIRTIDELAAALAAVREGDEARLAIEVALLKAARPDHDPSTEGIMRRLERLERSDGAEPAAAGDGDPGSPGVSPNPPAEPTPKTGDVDPRAEAGDAEGPGGTPGENQSAKAAGLDGRPPARPPTPDQPAPGPEPVEDDPFDLERLIRIWPAVLDALGASAPGPVASYFEGTRPVSAGDGRIEVGFPAEAAFNRRNADKPERRQKLVEAVRAVVGADAKLTFITLDGGSASPPAAVEDRLTEEELVARVKSEFNAEEVI